MRRDGDATVSNSHAPASGAASPRRVPATASYSREQYRCRPVSVAVDPVALVIAETFAVSGALTKYARSQYSTVSAILGGTPNLLQLHRRGVSVGGTEAAGGDSAPVTNRWGLRKGKMGDNPLITGFGKLRHELASVKDDIRLFDALLLLEPFLQVIRAKGTAAPITILALRALKKLILYGIFNPESPRYSEALSALSSALTHCQFDVIGEEEEVVLLLILEVMEEMMTFCGGERLSDNAICDLLGRALTICSRKRFSDALRSTAESRVSRMVQIIFEDSKHFEDEDGDEALARDTEVQLDPSMPEEAQSSKLSSFFEHGSSSDEALVRNSTSSLGSASVDLRPYSLAAVSEAFRALVGLLDPHDKNHSDQMRVMALRINHVVLEVAGPSIARQRHLKALLADDLCRHLFQLCRSDNLALLHEALKVTSTLLSTCRSVLKIQTEYFIHYLSNSLKTSSPIPRDMDPTLYQGIPQAAPPTSLASQSGRSTPVSGKMGQRPPEVLQAMCECLSGLIRTPTFLLELHVGYDCDEDRLSLATEVVNILARSALPDAATWSTTSVPPLCLDALLRIVNQIASRLDQLETATVSDMEALEETRARRRRKKLLIKGSATFNKSPMDGLRNLLAEGILVSLEPKDVANFLRFRASRIDKAVLGDFLSKKGNEAILESFVSTFDFTGRRIDEALRLLLSSFRLPGESLLIERIVTKFADMYCAANPDVGFSSEAAFVLVYAIIMLNVDQHSTKLGNQRRMSNEDFARNLRGVNNGADFASDLIAEVFFAISAQEIVLPEEHSTKDSFDYAWNELLVQAEAAGPLTVPVPSTLFDADLFAVIFDPLISAMCYVFQNASDDTVFARVVTGFDQCGALARHYGLVEVADSLVLKLCRMSGLSVESSLSTSVNTEIEIEGRTIVVSTLASRFGSQFRQQLAALLLFRVLKGSEKTVEKGWEQITRVLLNLFAHSLIPAPFTSELSPIPLKSQKLEAKPIDSGFFSSFLSTMLANDDPPPPSDEEIDSCLASFDCLAQCGVEDVMVNIKELPKERLVPFVEALLSNLPEAENAIAVKAENVSMNGGKPQGPGLTPSYDPSIPFCLEWAAALATRDEATVALVGRRVVQAVQEVLRDVRRHHLVSLGRVLFLNLKLLQASYAHDYVRAPVLLYTISSKFSPALLSRTWSPLLQGLTLVVGQPGPLRNEIMTSPDFWLILNSLVANVAESATAVFELLERGTFGSPPAIMADNYEAAIALLDRFASAASAEVAADQKGARHSHRGRPKPPKQDKPNENAVVVRGLKAIQIIYGMTERIPQLLAASHLESSQAWQAYWLPVFSSLTQQCTNPCREVRQSAFNSLRQSLLSKELTSSDHKEWTAIFGEVLFPLILRLLKPEVFSLDKDGMSETRVQASSLLCKVFLQYLVELSAWDGMLDLWLKIIEIMDRLMNSGQGDLVEDAVSENLKNVLLYMSSNGVLSPAAQETEQEKLWTETWKRIERFLPDLKPLKTELEEHATNEKK